MYIWTILSLIRIFRHVCCVVDPGATKDLLRQAASKCLWTAFRPSTPVAYNHMFADFLIFLVLMGLSLHQVTTFHILPFMEYLIEYGFSASNVSTYITGIRSMLIIHGADKTPLGIKNLAFCEVSKNQQAV